jgi:hypothetical protein
MEAVFVDMGKGVGAVWTVDMFVREILLLYLAEEL